MKRILAVDPGDVRIGLALSDPSQTIARPLETLTHSSRARDVQRIMQLAEEHDVERIVVGVPYDDEGETGPQARKATRLLEALNLIGSVPALAWDESGSTASARKLSRTYADLDSRAAAVILQDYLDAQSA